MKLFTTLILVVLLSLVGLTFNIGKSNDTNKGFSDVDLSSLNPQTVDVNQLTNSGIFPPSIDWNAKNQPNYVELNNYPATSGGGSGGGTPPPDLSSYDQGINNINTGIGRLDTQRNSGLSGIDSSYQNALSQLLLGRNRGQQSYDTNVQDTRTGYVKAKNTIGAQAGQALNGLQRLLGSRGAGGGSAYNIAAPQAVARGATLQRADVGGDFSKNMQALDTNWNNFLQDYGNQVSGAGSQRDQAKQGLEGSIATNRGTLLQQLAQLQAQRAQAAGGNPAQAAQPYVDQANQALDQAANYTVAPINYQTQAYQAPSLASYNPTPQPTASFSKQNSDYFSPYLASLLGKKQQIA